jgi:hypothetical protein
MDQATHNRIVSFLWGIADDVLRDLFRRGKYPDVILPSIAEWIRAARPGDVVVVDQTFNRNLTGEVGRRGMKPFEFSLQGVQRQGLAEAISLQQ